MAGPNKPSLQRRCSAAGLSTEGTKKDLRTRLTIYNSVGTVEAIIYKEAVQVPQNGESTKGQCCGQEIAHELQSAMSGQSATGSARWGNPARFLMLETIENYKKPLGAVEELMDNMKELEDSTKELEDRLASIEADVPKSKSTASQ